MHHQRGERVAPRMPPQSTIPSIEIKPHRNLRSLYLTYLLIAVWAGVFPWLIPASLFLSPVMVLMFTIPILLMVIVTVLWTGAYYRTIIFRLTEEGISLERGVWHRHAGTIPYDRISDIEIVQGPLSRLLGISLLKVRTEEFCGGKMVNSELKINGLTDAGSLKNAIKERMRNPGREERP